MRVCVLGVCVDQIGLERLENWDPLPSKLLSPRHKIILTWLRRRGGGGARDRSESFAEHLLFLHEECCSISNERCLQMPPKVHSIGGGHTFSQREN